MNIPHNIAQTVLGSRLKEAAQKAAMKRTHSKELVEQAFERYMEAEGAEKADAQKKLLNRFIKCLVIYANQGAGMVVLKFIPPKFLIQYCDWNSISHVVGETQFTVFWDNNH